MTNKKEKIFQFITEINLPKIYANLLIDNGFDLLDVLITQTKKGIALSYDNLREIGIKLPGERAKILVHLEEVTGNFDYLMNNEEEKEIIYEEKNNNKDYMNSPMYKWLSSIKCEKYVNKFIDNGYYNPELLFMQMGSKQPLNEEILSKDLGLNKNVAKKIICKLIESSTNYINRLKMENKEKNLYKYKSIIYEENNKIKSCDMCFVI